MAMLIPILLPSIVAAGANIGLGLTNAFQGDSSSVSFQIGKKVFSSQRSCNLDTLPPEIRARIILMALESSKSLIMPDHYFANPAEPLLAREMREVERHNPLNPESENYRSIVGDSLEANGYPITAWRWQLVCREWYEVLEKPLWENMEIKGHRRYANLASALQQPGGFRPASRVKSMTMREGFRAPDQLYSILLSSAFTSLDHLSIMPDYPTSFHPLVFAIPLFPFGLQLIRPAKPLLSFTYGLPIESTTNSASRQQLRVVGAPSLSVSCVTPTIALFTELKELVESTAQSLTIRYVGVRRLVEPDLFLSLPLQSFSKIRLILNLPRPRKTFVGTGSDRTLIDDPQSPGLLFLSTLMDRIELADEEVQDRYEIWSVENWDIPGQAHNADKTQVWPKKVLWDADYEEEAEVETRAEVKRSSSSTESTKPGRPAHWDRQTNLRLLGGLINLRLESHKR